MRPEARRVDSWVILLSAPVLLTVWRYHGQAAHSPFGGGPTGDFGKAIFQFATFFALCLVLPLLYARLKMRRPLADLGLGAGDWRFSLKLAALLLPVAAAAAYAGSRMDDVRAEYPLARILASRPDLVLPYEIAYVLLYYAAWEFYFRGFILFGLKDDLGAGPAVCIQTISSCLVHLGKPESEIVGSIAVGVAFGLIALRARSVWPCWLLHASLGVLTDLFVLRVP